MSSLLITGLFLSSALFFLLLYLKYLRYGSSREIILNVFCFLQGRRNLWVRDPALAHRILLSSATKGSCIERLISTQAFLPIISLESIDGELWNGMKKNFLIFRSQLPPLQELSNIAAEITEGCVSRNELVDCARLAKLVFHSMLLWIFDISPTEEESEMIFRAASEWRKELAIKGKGDMVLKMKAVKWIKKLVKSSKYYSLFGEKWENSSYWSIILQPFFISPIINITDIAVTLKSASFQELYNKQNYEWSEQLLVCGINMNHPFPVLERYFPEGLAVDTSTSEKCGEVNYSVQPNTHVFMPMDDIGHSLAPSSMHSAAWCGFGAGKRACAGRDIANIICAQLFPKLLRYREFKPAQGHVHSGRNNDFQETWTESFFQLKLLLQITWKLIKRKFPLFYDSI